MIDVPTEQVSNSLTSALCAFGRVIGHEWSNCLAWLPLSCTASTRMVSSPGLPRLKPQLWILQLKIQSCDLGLGRLGDEVMGTVLGCSGIHFDKDAAHLHTSTDLHVEIFRNAVRSSMHSLQLQSL